MLCKGQRLFRMPKLSSVPWYGFQVGGLLFGNLVSMSSVFITEHRACLLVAVCLWPWRCVFQRSLQELHQLSCALLPDSSRIECVTEWKFFPKPAASAPIQRADRCEAVLSAQNYQPAEERSPLREPGRAVPRSKRPVFRVSKILADPEKGV